ncbi:hypothetical protein JMN32_18380 [Fulvivirga sp. 29W222]|uniref:Uncharacterized protein n=1 Tax=Fulvivirga marina TaxID=2494733 RepID=A0A937G0I4_9BACT|nr:hypothetical protein [Fulvivirga marina]MBL6448288.1 hypothetical protein [Fulvivirga marina]
MESNKELEFKIMVTFPDILKVAIENHNAFRNTDFEIIETVYDEVPFCTLKVTKYQPSDIFGLGYKLAALEEKYRNEGSF